MPARGPALHSDPQSRASSGSIYAGRTRARLAAAGRGGLVHVDGGVNSKTAEIVGSHGIDVCIVGSALFQRGQDASDEVDLVKEHALRGYSATTATAR